MKPHRVRKPFQVAACHSIKTVTILQSIHQRWSPRGRPWPRGQVLKSLALASRPQVLENWPVLGSRTAVFFELLKFCGAVEKFFGKRFFVGIAWKIFVKTFFFFFESTCACVLGLGHEHSCPWPRECLSSERLSLTSDFFGVLGLGLEPCVLDSTSAIHMYQNNYTQYIVIWITPCTLRLNK